MSKLLISEPPLQVIPSLAEEIGLNEAIVLQQLHYWTQRSPNKEEDQFGEERRWVYKTLSEWEEEFPFWSRSTIKRTLRSLKDDGLIIAEQKRKSQGDPTVWYAVDYDRIPPGGQDDQRGGGQSEQEGRSKRPTGGGQDDQHRAGALCAGASETTTTETTTENGSSGSAPARGDSSGDSVPSPDVEVEVSDSALSFLPKEYDVYETEIRRCMERYDPSCADQLAKNQFGNVPFSFSAIVDLSSTYDWPVFVAAVVVCGNEAKRPNPRYVKSICEGFANPDSSTNANHGRAARRDDPKQRPADNHERISAAVDAAFDGEKR